MKKYSKFFYTTATVVAIISPLVPKNLYINLNQEPTKVKSVGIEASSNMCKLSYTHITENNLEICEYDCVQGNKKILYKIVKKNVDSCKMTIN